MRDAIRCYVRFSRIAFCSVCSYLPQPRVVQPEMMGDFVAEDVMDHCAYLLHRAATHFNGALVDADLVRQDQAVVVGAFRLRDAVVKAQEMRRVAYSSQPHRLPVWPFLDYHLDVVQFFPERLGQVIQRLGHEALKGAAIHSGCIIPPIA